MFLTLAILVSSVFLLWLAVNVSRQVWRNYRAHKFFKINSVQIPVLPTNLLYGNMEICWNKKSYRYIGELHEKFGSTFGYFFLHYPMISTTNLDLIKHIELDDAQNHVNKFALKTPLPEVNDSIFFVEDDNWRRIRKVVNPAMTYQNRDNNYNRNRYIKSDDVTIDIENVVDQYVDGIEFRLNEAERSTGKRSFIMDADDMSHRFALAVIFSFLYRQDNAIDFRAKSDDWTQLMLRSEEMADSPFVILPIMFPFIMPVIRFFLPLHFVGGLRKKIIAYILEATDINRKARAKYEKMLEMSNDGNNNSNTGSCPMAASFHDVKKSGDFRRRLVDTIIDAFLDRKIDSSEFIGSASFLLFAGFETTADTMTYLIWELARHPDIQEILRKDMAINGDESEYLHWCVMEAVRLHPAVPLGTGRTLGKDIEVNGLKLPKGIFVMPSTYTIQHDPSVWPEPERFMPERWQKSNERHPAAFMGFGLGIRNCVGNKLATYEIKKMIRCLLIRYKIETCDETTKVYNFSTSGLAFTTLDQPIKIKVTPL